MSTATSPRRRRDTCSACGKPVAAEHAPFCSRGCRDRDLLNWLGDAYRVPGPPADDAPCEYGEERLDSERRGPV